jgi:hypothetical protein
VIDGLYPNLEEVQGLRSQAIASALKRFSPDECQNYLAAAGYDAT